MKAKTALLIVLCLICCVLFSACGCDHDWVDATCLEPKTCAKCEETEGEALGHTEGDWEIDEEATILADGMKIIACEDCDAVLEKEKYSLEKYYEDGRFIFSPTEYAEKYAGILADNNSTISSAEVDSQGWVMMDVTLNNGSAVIAFADGEDPKTYENREEKGVDEMTIIFAVQTATDDAYGVADTIIYYFMAMDPTLDVSTADQMCADLFNDFSASDDMTSSLTKNGIVHNLSVENLQYFVLLSSPEA